MSTLFYHICCVCRQSCAMERWQSIEFARTPIVLLFSSIRAAVWKRLEGKSFGKRRKTPQNFEASTSFCASWMLHTIDVPQLQRKDRPVNVDKLSSGSCVLSLHPTSIAIGTHFMSMTQQKGGSLTCYFLQWCRKLS